MGGVPYHEDLLVGAQRELKEETGLIAAKWEQSMVLHTSNCVTDEVGYVYLATELEQGSAQPDETEALQIKRVPLRVAHEWAIKGIITDAISVAALLRLAPVLW
jgi:8-oxo-dGTP pyrophosphatase MutT (NUDIX family)